MGSHLLNSFLLFTLAAVVFVVYSRVFDAPAHTDPAISIPYTNKEGVAMTSVAVEAPKTAGLSLGGSGIPAMDQAVPAKVETATFALG